MCIRWIIISRVFGGEETCRLSSQRLRVCCFKLKLDLQVAFTKVKSKEMKNIFRIHLYKTVAASQAVQLLLRNSYFQSFTKGDCIPVFLPLPSLGGAPPRIPLTFCRWGNSFVLLIRTAALSHILHRWLIYSLPALQKMSSQVHFLSLSVSFFFKFPLSQRIKHSQSVKKKF